MRGFHAPARVSNVLDTGRMAGKTRLSGKGCGADFSLWGSADLPAPGGAGTRMPLTDTHVHFDPDPAAAGALVARAREAGVRRLLAVGGSNELNATAAAAAAAFPAAVRLALGLDRDQTTGMAERLADLETRVAALAPAAIGEAGLDYHHRPQTRREQRELFAAMLHLAARLRLPIVVHTRAADEDTLALLDEAGSRALAAAGRLGVIHCFTGSRAFAARLLERGLFISFSGIVTFANAAALRETAAGVPDERLLIETDTPFLAPVPCRGRRNEPAFLPHVAAAVARARGCPVAALAALTSANAERLFGPWPADEV